MKIKLHNKFKGTTGHKVTIKLEYLPHPYKSKQRIKLSLVYVLRELN